MAYEFYVPTRFLVCTFGSGARTFFRYARKRVLSFRKRNRGVSMSLKSVFRIASFLLVGVSGSALAAIPAAEVSAPMASSSTSYPFGGAAHTREPTDLAAIGYVEEEVFATGNANVYDWPKESATAVVRAANAKYTTRVLIRRPLKKTKFSGNVVVEMLNPSNLFDLNIGWALSHKQIVRNGDAWVGITAKPVAVVTLKAFDPIRYASLSWPNPVPLDDARNCATVAADSSRATENGLVWDIHRQVAMWLKQNAPSNPFRYGGDSTRVEKLYAWGYSQTGGFLYTYINAFHSLDAKELGKPLFDGYLVAVAGGPSPINQCAERLANDDPRRQIRNAGVPVIRIMSQSDYLNAVPMRRNDNDTAPDLYRGYEIAGAGHATPDELSFAAAPADLEKGGRAVPPMGCNEGPRSRFPSSLAFNSALRNLDQWARKGIAPPRAEAILVENGKPVLDQHGNVRGGIRSPFVDVPTSTWNGNSTGPSFCRIAGHEIPFAADKLKSLYPSHAAYEKAVRDNVRSLVKARFVVAEDGDELIEAARRAQVP